MKLLVKYGSSLSIAEGQCLWAIRKALGQDIPVPEVYGWRRDGNEVFIYMQLIEGQTLEDIWDKLAQTDRALIRHQLRHIVTSLRSLRQASGDPFVGKFWLSYRVTIKS
jgi:aminoglycoside phosphotransferase (APT) family kinase protein